jgi:hypothetical protein
LLEIQRPENKTATERVYSDADELLTDIAGAYRTIIADLYAAGCRSLQFDDVTWAGFCDAKLWQMYQSGNQNLRELLERNLRLNNLALQHRPKDLVVTTHVCRETIIRIGLFGRVRTRGRNPVWARRTWRRSTWNTIPTAPAISRPCDFSATASRPCWASSLQDRPLENGPRFCGASRRRRNTSTLTGFASAHSAALLPPRGQYPDGRTTVEQAAFIKEIADEIWK